MNTRYSTYVTIAALMTTVILGGCLDKSDDGGLTQSANPPVGGTNRAPTISGNPPLGIKVGEAYSFTPSASDADGDAITFSIANKPSWASFSTGSGALTGTPTLVDVGSFSSIRITVSDGTNSASLNAFAIDVTQIALGSTTLSWSAPTENEDGTPLLDLAGFTIYYGRSSGNYSNEIRIDNPSVTTYLVDNLSPDTYYFSATAFNGAGIESSFATEVFKDVN